MQKVGGRLLAAGPGEMLHVFVEGPEEQGGEGQPSLVAERILALVDGKRSVAEIAQTLCAEFEVDLETCAQDTAEFVRLLVDRKLLVLRGGQQGGGKP